MAKRVKIRYSILYIPDAEYIKFREFFDWDSSTYSYKTIKETVGFFKTEEEAYKHLLEEHMTTYMCRERNLQIILLMSELSKLDPDIAYKMFLTNDKEVKPVNHVTIMGYLKRHKMFKEGFKAFCDVVAIMGLGAGGDSKKVCFEHYEIEKNEVI